MDNIVKYNGIERYIYSDTYVFFLKWKDMRGTPDEWERCIENSRILDRKYLSHPLLVSIMVANLELIEQFSQNKPIKNRTRAEWELALKGVKNKT